MESSFTVAAMPLLSTVGVARAVAAGAAAALGAAAKAGPDDGTAVFWVARGMMTPARAVAPRDVVFIGRLLPLPARFYRGGAGRLAIGPHPPDSRSAPYPVARIGNSPPGSSRLRRRSGRETVGK